MQNIKFRNVVFVIFLVSLFTIVNAENAYNTRVNLNANFIDSGQCAPIRLKLPYIVISGEKSTVCMSLTVDNFTNMESFQFPITWDDKVLKFKSVNIPPSSFLNTSNFDYSNPASNELRFIWHDAYEKSLANNSVLVEICFDVIGTLGQSSQVAFLEDINFEMEFIRFDLVLETIDYIVENGNVSIGDNNKCVNYINADLDDTGYTKISAEDLFKDTSVNTVLIEGKTELIFDCDDLGIREVNVWAKYDSRDTVNCRSIVRVGDRISPTIEMKPNPVVSISSDSTVELNIGMFVDSINDNCGYTVSIEPTTINCKTESPVEIKIRVVDKNGNCTYNKTMLEVNYMNDYELNCLDKFIINVEFNKSVKLDIQDVLDGNQECVGSLDLRVFDEDGNEISDLTFDRSEIDNIYNYVISESQSGKNCNGMIFIVGYDCDDLITENDIIWPCDIKNGLEIKCISYETKPQDLFDQGIDTAYIWPVIKQIDCHTDSIAWSDDIFEYDSYMEILRKWIIFDRLKPNDKFSYVQEIYLKIIGNEHNRSICDTLPWSAPFGDCESGHTKDDLIELPEKLINIFWLCDDYDEKSFSPSELDLIESIDSRNSKPIKEDKNCGNYVEVFYSDIDTIIQEYKKLIRKWAIVNDFDGDVINWYQIIKVNNTPVVCDTLPWDAPIGDCESGHTINDIVEWPRDIIVNSTRINLWNLKNNPNVHPFDVEPRLFVSCGDFDVSFTDVSNGSGDSLVVSRTWRLYFPSTEESFEYIQKIIVIGEIDLHFCSFTSNGIAVPDVNVLDNLYTNEFGCVELNIIVEGSNIKPSKNDEFLKGIDLGDILLLQKYLLGIVKLNPYQLLAADLDLDGKVTFKDLFLLKEYFYIVKNYDFPVWLFVDSSQDLIEEEFYKYKDAIEFSSSRIDYTFIAVKKGDVNNSWGGLNDKEVLQIDDLNIIANEKYIIPVILKNTFNLEGLSLRLKYDPNKIVIQKVNSDIVPGLNMNQNVEIEGDEILIDYISSNFSLFNGGNYIEKGQQLLNIEFIAKEGTILSESISISNGGFSMIYTKDIDFNVEIEWKNALAIGDVSLTERNKILVYPNPAKEEVSVKLANENIDVNYTILDIVGNEVMTEKLTKAPINISKLKSGLYYIKLFDVKSIVGIKKLVVY